MERIERLQRHLITTHWTEQGWSLVEAATAVKEIDWDDCGGLAENVTSFFTDYEKAHLFAVIAERIELLKPWLSRVDIENEAMRACEALSPCFKHSLLDVPCSSEYFHALVH